MIRQYSGKNFNLRYVLQGTKTLLACLQLPRMSTGRPDIKIRQAAVTRLDKLLRIGQESRCEK